MAAAAPPPPPGPRFSPDGAWFWTGTEWKPAISPDRLWRWNGYQWVPNVAAPGAGATAGATVGIVVGALVVVGLVGLISVVVLLTMGHQISNVFSNVAAALGASPSP